MVKIPRASFKRELKLFYQIKGDFELRTIVIILANHKGQQKMNQSILEVKKRGKNVLCERVAIGFIFTPDWMNKWCEPVLSQSYPFRRPSENRCKHTPHLQV